LTLLIPSVSAAQLGFEGFENQTVGVDPDPNNAEVGPFYTIFADSSGAGTNYVDNTRAKTGSNSYRLDFPGTSNTNYQNMNYNFNVAPLCDSNVVISADVQFDGVVARQGIILGRNPGADALVAMNIVVLQINAGGSAFTLSYSTDTGTPTTETVTLSTLTPTADVWYQVVFSDFVCTGTENIRVDVLDYSTGISTSATVNDVTGTTTDTNVTGITYGVCRGVSSCTAQDWWFDNLAISSNANDIYVEGPTFDGETGAQLGSSAAIDGDYAIVGAPYEDGTGAAYVYFKDAGVWEEQQRLVASDAEDNARFGNSVSINNTTVIVGARQDNATLEGAAYVFTRSGTVWTQQQKLTASDAAAEDEYGASVAVDSDTAAVSATYQDGSGTNRGKVYIYTRTAGVWSEQDTIIASDAANNDVFGTALALEGDEILVGASGEDGAGSNRGAVYYFTRSAGNWTQQQKVTASPSTDFMGYGNSVAIDGNLAVIGASAETAGSDCPGDSSLCDEFSGAAYVLALSGGVWSQTRKLTAGDTFSDRHDGALCGTSVALVESRIAVGCPESGGPDGNGAAYLWQLTDNAWQQFQKLTATDPEQSSQYGYAVGLTMASAVVGAPRMDANGVDSGKAYFYNAETNDPSVTVQFTNPEESEDFVITSGNTVEITITVDASSDDGIDFVDIYTGFGTGGTLLCTDSAAPYSCNEEFASGDYALTVEATSNTAATALATVTFSVTSSGIPQVSITSPTEGSTTGASITATATASDSGDGTITSVAFYDGAVLTPVHLLCFDQTSPYTCAITYNSDGSKILTAVATDDENNDVQDAVSFTVSGSSGGGGPPGGTGNPLSQMVQFITNAWGFDAAWIVGAIIMGIILVPVAVVTHGNALVSSAIIVLVTVANITMSLWAEWAILVMVFLIIAIAGNRMFSKRDGDDVA
jgi:hypothetical protein